jgi:hypothetical protein
MSERPAPRRSRYFGRSPSTAVCCFIICLVVSGCSSGMMPVVPPPPTFSGNSMVVVLLSATANDKLANFNMVLTSLALNDDKGNSIDLFTNPNPNTLFPGEFMHLANHPEPLVTMSIPQGLYTSATAKVAYCSFTDVTFQPEGTGLTEATYAQGLCSQGTGNATVSLTGPIAVTGPVVALSLNLQVPQSFTLAGTGTTAAYTITPTFTLAPLALKSQPTNSDNGKISGLAARVTAVKTGASSFTVQTGDSISFDIHSLNETTYQGITGFSALTAGTLVDVDFAIQQDGSFAASRIEASNPAAIAAAIGPFLFSGAQTGEFVTLPTEYQGCTSTGTPFCGSAFRYDANTVFTVSSEYANLKNLPFVPVFTGTSFLAGQNISVFSSGVTDARSFETATTITLKPQTVNGTVTAVSSDGGFTVYTVSLASYDLFPVLQSYGGTLIRLNDPNTVMVYVDASTQVLNSKPISAGTILRFTGLVFDDMGTLRMDCGQIKDGVSE